MSDFQKQQTIRQAETAVELVGLLKEKDLEITQVKQMNGQFATVIKGKVTIQTAEHESHNIRVYASEFTNAGKPNSSFASWKTCLETMNDKSGAEGADKVMLKGAQLSVNEFYAQSGALVSSPQISASWISRTDAEAECVAKFKAEIVLDKVRPEFAKGEETGRYIIEGYLPMYAGSVAPIEFVATQEVGEYIKENYVPKGTAMIWGNIVSTAVIDQQVLEGFGEQRAETSVKYINELLITGGNRTCYESDSPKAYNSESITKALVDRDIRLQQKKQNAQQSKPVVPQQAGFNGFGGVTGGQTPNAPAW